MARLMAKKRKTPERSCVACRTTRDKQHLLRVVRMSSGGVAVDPGGKMPGRGAYLCASADCICKALKEKRLSRALRTEVPDDVVRDLEDLIEKRSKDM